MHSHHRARGKILFEVLCALSLAASLAAAWDQTGSSALLASASIVALFALYWSFGLFARRRVDVAQPAAVVAQPTATVPQPISALVEALKAEVQPAAQEEIFAREAVVPSEPEPAAAAPKKRPARKAKKAATVVAPVVERPEPVAVGEPAPEPFPLEQLFDPQPFVRQARPAFGRKARGPRPLSAA